MTQPVTQDSWVGNVCRRPRNVTPEEFLAPGEHACWTVASEDTFLANAVTWLEASPGFADKRLMFGPRPVDGLPDGIGQLNPLDAFLGGGPLDPDAMVECFRRETALARREGYRSLRIVADMDWILPAGGTFEEVLGFELRIDEVFADEQAAVVCAYRPRNFDPALLKALHSVHPHNVNGEPMFRLFNAGVGRWQLAGEVDVFAVGDLSAALDAVLGSAADVRICLRDLEFIDVGGLRAIAFAAQTAGGRVILEKPSPLFRRCWTLLGYPSSLKSVELVS